MQEAHKALLSSDKEMFRLSVADEVPGLNVLPRILLPLAGPEEFELDVSSKLEISPVFLVIAGRRATPSRTAVPTVNKSSRA